MWINSNVIKRLMHYTWDLAYFKLDETPITHFTSSCIQIVKNPYKDKWFADPFILSYSKGKLELLVEEFDSNVKRGRIARIEIDTNKREIVNCCIVLELPTHLSFPVIYREDGKIYVIPENSESGSFYIYEYDRTQDKLINPQLIIQKPLTDAIIDKRGEKYLVYATSLPDPNGNCLYIYEADNLFGPYKKISETLLNDKTARMAGYFIHEDEKMIRPAQDCNKEYGEAVVFYDGNSVVYRLSPHQFKYSGVHTFNTYKEMGIIDLKIYDYYPLVKLKNLIKRIFR